jgi:SAM-dependent methyltransferase
MAIGNQTAIDSNASLLLAFRKREKCEICGADDSEILYENAFNAEPLKLFLDTYYDGRIDISRLAGGLYSIRRCRSCGFLWQGEVLTDQGLEILYESWIDAAASWKKAKDQPLFARARLAHQVSLGACLLHAAPAQIRALDFGMGWGLWCEMARAFGFSAAGTELSIHRVRHARSRGIEVVADLFESDRAFDLINTEQVFEHVTDPVILLRSLTAHLAPGGVLRISVPDASRFLRIFASNHWRPGKDALHPLEHVNGFNHASLLLLAERTGLRPVGIGRFLNAHARAATRTGMLNLRAAMESLNGQIRGLSIWFEHA